MPEYTCSLNGFNIISNFRITQTQTKDSCINSNTTTRLQSHAYLMNEF